MLILYPTNLINSFIVCVSFIMNYPAFLKYTIMLSTNTDNFTSLPIALASTSSIALSSFGDSEHPCLVPDHTGNISTIFSLRC